MERSDSSQIGELVHHHQRHLVVGQGGGQQHEGGVPTLGLLPGGDLRPPKRRGGEFVGEKGGFPSGLS